MDQPAGKRKIVIADDEQLICSMLAKLIHADQLHLEIAGFAYDGGSLMQLIEKEKPDIVITDICMPILDGLEVIRRVRDNGVDCRFIVISGYRQFDYAYNALKYDVSDYLLKPIDEGELNTAIERILGDLRVRSEIPGTDNQSLRLYFVKKELPELPKTKSDPSSVNRLYGTHFEDGCFQALMVKFDFENDRTTIMENSLTSLQQKAEEFAGDYLKPLCSELLLDRKADGVQILMNYPAERKNEIREKTSALLASIKNVTDRFTRIGTTIGVGRPYAQIWELSKSCAEADHAIWQRMFLGTGRLVAWVDRDADAMIYQREIDQHLNGIKHAFDVLDVPEFLRSAAKLLEMPPAALVSAYTISRITALSDLFFAMNGALIGGFTDVDSAIRKVNSVLSMSSTIAEYRQAFREAFRDLMEEIVEQTHRQNIRPIRQAIASVEAHYAQHLSLEVMAREVNMSPVYFSSIFKRETGRNFTDYVNDYRLKIAKERLKNTNMGIGEIAYQVGFQDARYFSKVFKKGTGITPAEYRRIFG